MFISLYKNEAAEWDRGHPYLHQELFSASYQLENMQKQQFIIQ